MDHPSSTVSASGASLPHDLSAEALVTRLEAISGKSDLDAFAPLISLGVDSLDVIEWIYGMEDDFGVLLTDDDMFFETVGDMSVATIAQQLSTCLSEGSS
jgi:acyl carrier protein